MRYLPGLLLGLWLLALPPVATAEAPAERAARSLSELLGASVAPDQIEFLSAKNLSTEGSLPSPLRRLAGSNKRFVIVRLSGAKFRHPIVQATLEAPPSWAEILPGVGAVVVEAADSSGAQSCFVESCTDGACQTVRVWVDEGISCPPAESGGGTGGNLFCSRKMCRPGLGCETMPVPPLANGECPPGDMCSSNDDCLPPMQECAAGECFCTGEDCRCMEDTIEIPADEACPVPECTKDSDCSSGGGNQLLDNILETTTAQG